MERNSEVPCVDFLDSTASHRTDFRAEFVEFFLNIFFFQSGHTISNNQSKILLNSTYIKLLNTFDDNSQIRENVIIDTKNTHQ